MGGRSFGDVEDYAGRVMLLIDGYVVQDNLFDQAYIDESGLIDLELVERVEYVPGTGSVTYGNNALLGIINVVTRRGRDFDGARVSAEVSSRGASRQRATWGKRLESGAEVLLSASTLDIDGRNLYFPAYDTPATNFGVAEGLDGERSQRVFGKLSWSGWTVQGAWVERHKNVPTNPSAVHRVQHALPDPGRDRLPRCPPRDRPRPATVVLVDSLMLGRYAYGNTARIRPERGRRVRRGREVRRARLPWAGGGDCDQKFVGRWFADHTLVFGAEIRDDHRQSFRRRFLSPGGEVTYRDDARALAPHVQPLRRRRLPPERAVDAESRHAVRRRRRPRRQPQSARGADLAAGLSDDLEGFLQRGLQDAQRQRPLDLGRRARSPSTSPPPSSCCSASSRRRRASPARSTATGAATC